MKTVLLLLSVLIAGISCSKKQNVSPVSPQKSVVVIDSSYPETRDTLRISQIADSLYYIILSGVRLSNVLKIQSVKPYLFVQDGYDNLYLFDCNGIFLRKINRAISRVFNFDVLEGSKQVYVATSHGFEVYNYEGDLLRSISGQDIWGGNFFVIVNLNEIAVAHWNDGKNNYRLSIIDSLGTPLKEFTNPEKFVSEKGALRNSTAFHRTLFRYRDQIRFHPLFNDTLYTLESRQLTPVFVEQKIFKVPLNQRLEYVGDVETFRNYCFEKKAYITRIFESDKFVFCVYNLGYIGNTLSNFLVFDKKNLKLTDYTQNFDFSSGHLHYGIFNDYDGGLPFNPAFQAEESLIEWWQADKFRQLFLHGRGIGDRTYRICSNVFVSKERQEKLKQMVNRLQADDAVLTVVKLK